MVGLRLHIKATTLTLLLSTLVGVHADNNYEKSLLDNWKLAARKTAVGSKLAELLDSTTTKLKQNSTQKESLYVRGYLLGIIGCTTMAIDDLSKAIELDPHYAAAYAERGVCYMDMKKFDRARCDLDKAVQLNPYSGDARYARGKLYLELEKPYSAISDFRACKSPTMKFNPGLPGELPANFYNAPDYYLGVCYESLGKADEAVKSFKSSIKTSRLGGSGYLHRYSDQPLDATTRVSMMEGGY